MHTVPGLREPRHMSETADWAQRLLASSHGREVAPRPAPRRVIDGALDETLRRPVWCLCAQGLRSRDFLQPLVELLEHHKRTVVLLEGADSSVTQACERLAVCPSEVVQVETEHSPALPPNGARRLILDARPQSLRGVIVVPDVDALASLFRRQGSYVSGSTYHEI